jgi:hypothetical protein
MELHEALQRVKFDKRLIDWHIKQGIITEEEVKKHLQSLNDVAAQSMQLDLENDYSSGNGAF